VLCVISYENMKNIFTTVNDNSALTSLHNSKYACSFSMRIDFVLVEDNA
jgi:hypothetical protein